MESDRFNAQANMSDAQRIQSLQIAEGQRVQDNEASGAQFMFNTRETEPTLGLTD